MGNNGPWQWFPAVSISILVMAPAFAEQIPRYCDPTVDRNDPAWRRNVGSPAIAALMDSALEDTVRSFDAMNNAADDAAFAAIMNNVGNAFRARDGAVGWEAAYVIDLLLRRDPNVVLLWFAACPGEFVALPGYLLPMQGPDDDGWVDEKDRVETLVQVLRKHYFASDSPITRSMAIGLADALSHGMAEKEYARR